MRDLPIFRRHARPPGGRDRRRRRRGAPRRTAVRAGARVTSFARALGDEFLDCRTRRISARAPRDPTREDFAGEPLLHRDRGRGPDRAARAAAKSAGALVNVADRPSSPISSCPRSSTAVPLVIAISTGGASPILGRMLKARLEIADPGRLRPARRADERLSRPARDGDPVADHAAPLLGDGARRPDRGGGARRQRSRRKDASRARDRALGLRSAPSPAGEVYLVGAGPATPTSSPSAPSASCRRPTSCSTTA